MNDYTILELSRLQDSDEMAQLRFLLLHIKGSDKVRWKGKEYQAIDPYEMSFGDVVEMQRKLRDLTLGGQLFVFEKVFSISQEEQLQMLSSAYYPGWNYIVERFAWMADVRNKAMPPDPDPDLDAAGIKEMERFGEAAIIDALAGGDVLKWSAIEAMPYKLVFMKLCMDYTRNKIQKRYIARKSKKK